MDAIVSTFAGMATWERAYVADIEGKRDEAISHYEACISQTVKATAQWRTAEFSQSKLIAHMVSLPNNLALRSAVGRALSQIDAASHLRELRADGRFPILVSVDVEDGHAGMLDFFKKQLGVDNIPGTKITIADDAPLTLVLNLLELDFYQIRRIRFKVEELRKLLEKHRTDVENGPLYERVGYTIHIKKTLYPVSRVAAQLRNACTSYITFLDTYGSFIIRAELEAQDPANEAAWKKVGSFVGED